VSLLLKSFFSLIMFAQVLIALFSMLEIIGREERLFNPRGLRILHRVNGYIFLILAFIISYYCMPFLKATQGKISARVTLHSLFAIGVIAMLIVKIMFIRMYRKFMAKAPAFGLTIFFLSLGLIASSGGYYLVISAEMPQAGRKTSATQTAMSAPADSPTTSYQAEVKKGLILFNKWCAACHSVDSVDYTPIKPGPGLKGILKRETLPVSKRDATVENIRRQLHTPYQLMPPQTQLNDEETNQLIEFLKTI
jgi:mono/diheme cytochrome c family protein